ncbi:hypothetical protein F4777DRAFT_307656 [Nemania sp. FL0916]|nr:hypothetical protein F4777DRAFT_307656 [Nemania sp. FL0916]
MSLFSSSSSSNFKALRRRAQDSSSSTLHMHLPRPSTATSTDIYHSRSATDLLEPALDRPPSPEGIRAFSRRMQRGSISDQYLNDTANMSSGSSSLRSTTPETPWEQSQEATGSGLSRNSSQRSSVMRFRERPDSVQLFGKAVFSRKPKLRKVNSEQGHSSSSLVSLAEMPTDSAPELPKEQRFIRSMFTGRRARGASEASLKKYQISGPYDFHHVSHSSRDNIPAADRTLPDFSEVRPRTTAGVSNPPGGFSSLALNKPLPKTLDLQQDLERVPSWDSIQVSPPRPSRYTPDSTQASPIPPPPRTSSRISVRHDRTDSSSTSISAIHRIRSNSGCQSQPFILPPTDGHWTPPISRISDGLPEPHMGGGDDRSPYPISTMDDAAWPLTSSMSSLAEVPEEEEYHLTTIRSRTSVVSNRASLRGSISVPHLRRVSLSRATQRPPSNASDTLGRFDLLAAQRALRECDDTETEEECAVQDNWEDDIDYCYEHAAEADCDFAWERLSCDMEREDYFAQDSEVPHYVESSFESAGQYSGLAPASYLSADVPGLSPTSYGSGATPNGATTPTSLSTPMTSNFSLPRIDSSTQLKRDHGESQSSSSSFHEPQEFCLSPSLLIPTDYHEKMLQYERGELDISQHDEHTKFDKLGTFLYARSSASTTMSTLSEQSASSSRYPSSTFTRWTGSSTSSWQAAIDPQQPVTITLNDKEAVITPTNDVSMTVSTPVESPVVLPKQELGREGHSRAQSEATLLTRPPHDTLAPLESKIAKEPLKTHRRARTASRSHANVSPQFALFPQIPQRP